MSLLPRGISTSGAWKCFTSNQGESVKVGEVTKFEELSGHGWNENHAGMNALRLMNELRVPFIRDGILQQPQQRTGNCIGSYGKEATSLDGYKILDIGCGGGILCEPLGRLGATVTGIDPGKENISVASLHLPAELKSNVSYKCNSIEALATQQEEKEKYDAVVMSEVIEHVDRPATFVGTATTVLKPGGSLFLTTLDRTVMSYLEGIIWWVHMLGILPIGTHDWHTFLTPQETNKILTYCGLKTVTLREKLSFSAFNKTWNWSKLWGIHYAMHVVKM